MAGNTEGGIKCRQSMIENLGIIAEKIDKNTEALEKMTMALYLLRQLTLASLRESRGVPKGEGSKRWTFGSPFKEKS